MLLPVQVKTNQNSVLPTVAVDHVISHDPATIGRATDCRRQKKKKKKKKNTVLSTSFGKTLFFIIIIRRFIKNGKLDY